MNSIDDLRNWVIATNGPRSNIFLLKNGHLVLSGWRDDFLDSLKDLEADFFITPGKVEVLNDAGWAKRRGDPLWMTRGMG